MKRILALLMILVMVVGVFAGCSSKPAEEGAAEEVAVEEVEAVHLKMNMTTNENSTWYLGAMRFKEIVEEKTEGRYIIEIFPSEQLSGGNLRKGLEMVQTSTTDIDMHSTIIYTVMDPKFTVINMPWLIPTYEEADAVMNGEGGKAIFELAKENGVMPLAFGESGYRQVTNNIRPITEPADLNDIKMRVPGIKMFLDLYNEIGANPTTMDFAEVFTSLQQGTIDGEENPYDVIISAKLEEVQKYLTLWNYVYDAVLMSTSTKTWDMLSEEDKVVFQEAATEAMNYQKEENRLKDSENLAYLKEHMEVTKLTDEQVAVFKEVAKPVYVTYEEIIGMELLETFGYEK